MLGPGWTSRMLQTILHELLTNGESIDQVNEARRIYFARQKALADSLHTFGLDVHQADGINTWLPVPDERDAIVQLAAAGIRVAGGSSFLASDGLGAFIRGTAAAIDGDVTPIARAIAIVARPPGPVAHSLESRWT